MSSWSDDIESAISAFIDVAELAGDPIARADVVIEYLPAPHRPPPRLPEGWMAVYGFWSADVWLKIGKAGTKSGPRYVSHHYHLSAPSTLAKSLASDAGMRTVPGFDPLTPGEWIRSSTSRVNILLPETRAPELLSLLEAFLHLRLRPRYEG
jgi:hypothetical protein